MDKDLKELIDSIEPLDLSSFPDVEIDLSSFPEVDLSDFPELDLSGIPEIDLSTIPCAEDFLKSLDRKEPDKG